MGGLNIYDTTIPTMIRTITNVKGCLTKAEEFAKSKNIDLAEFVSARISPDMKPLSFQVQSLSNTSKLMAVRLTHHENKPWEDNESTFPELYARLDKTLDFLSNVKRSDFEGAETKDVEIFGGKMKFKGLAYVQEFAMANFYFHAVTTYAILRMKGVDVGKKDWLAY
jgi:uncharacterized protein